jgi:hypothetical protein
MLCSKKGCGLVVSAKGLCRKHYTAAWRKGQGSSYTDHAREYMSEYNARRLSDMGDVQRAAHNRKHAAYQRVWRSKHAARLREESGYGQRYLRKYGLTPENFELLLNRQGGVCAICGTPPSQKKRLAVDHNHKTGAVRGLLCDSCNHAIGEMKDSPSLLRRAAKYLDGFVR